MSQLSHFVSRHWGKLSLFAVLLGVGFAWLAFPRLRSDASIYWEKTLAWAELIEPSHDEDAHYWCPMHPQIKRSRANEVCPICNMALVPLEGDVSGERDELTLTPQQVQQAGVIYEPVLLRKLYREIDTTGRIEYDERRLAEITAWVRGKSRIDKLHVNFTGTRVERGEPMAELYSPELIAAQEEFLVALQSRRSAERASNGESNGRQRRSILDPAGMMDAARQKLRYWGMTTEQIDRLAESGKVQDSVTIHAPIGGTVIERNVREGQYVNEGDWLFRVAELSHLWLLVDVYEAELPLVHEGQRAEISVRSRPGETFEGIVAFVPPEVERETRTARVRIDVPNADRSLKPGMYARVGLRKELGEQLSVPADAVLWSGKRHAAIARLGAGQFQPREIRIDTTWAYPSEEAYYPGGRLEFASDRKRYHPVLAGLRPGEEVVTAAAFLLNAESQFQSVMTKMLPPESRSATLSEAVGEKPAGAIRDLLDAYYGLSGALAADQFSAVPGHGEALQQKAAALTQTADEANMAELAGQAERLSELAAALTATSVDNLGEARIHFGRLSRSLVSLLAENGGQTLMGEELYYFRCGMANVGYENWLWWSPETHNPYMGQKMLDCGKQLEILEP